MARDKTRKKGKGSAGFNRRSGEDFLHRNAARPDVEVCNSGLQFNIIEQVEGRKPGPGDEVTVHQRILLVDGTVIDDTYQQNEPAEFNLDEALEGYREGLQLMGEGSRYKFVIPPDLAWGKRGAGKKIGPNAVLIIDARLVSVE